MVTMAEKRDYYEVLGVSRTASAGQISEAYRKLALQYHPDRNPGDDEAGRRFKEAAEAFEVLNNQEKRAIYDRYGHAGLEGGGAAPHFHDVEDVFAAFGDMFADLFGGPRAGRRRRSRGADLRCDVELDLFEAARGTSTEVKFDRLARCEECNGSGAKPGTQPATCSYCGGRGQVVRSSGFFSMRSTCPACHGQGAVIRDPCRTCRGDGYVARPVTLKVDVPPGVDNNTRLRIAGEGHPDPRGGPPGDCYCFISVKPHPLFQRKGRHLLCEVPISYSQAALGATIEIPTLDGTDRLEVPAGTQNGHVFTLRGKGMPDPRHPGRGNLLVQVHIEVPKTLDAEHEELLRRLAELEKSQVTPKRRSFFEKLRDYFHSFL